MTGQSKFNRSPASGRTYALTRIALLTSLVSVGRLTFSFIPNVQPMTVLLICITFYYGWKMGLTVALLSVLITNLYLGMGPWTVAQIGAFAALILLSHMFKDSHQNTPLIFLQIYVAFLGILYGLVVSVIQAPVIGWNILLPYYLSGLGYDLLHAAGNAVFFPILYPACMRVFKMADASALKKRSTQEKGETNE